MSTVETAAAPRLGLPADLGIERVAALYAQLSPFFDAPTLLIDASAMSRVHGAALQLLAAFCRGRSAAGHETKWQAPGAVLLDAARQLALMPDLQIEEN